MIRIRSFFIAGVCAVSALIQQQALQAAITVNLDQTYQTIEGFGAMAGMPNLYRNAGGIFWSTRPDSYELDRYAVEMGGSCMRFALTPQAFPQPGVYDWRVLTNDFRLMRELVSRDCRNFLLSAWSPPAWMKDNQQVVNGGHLLSNQYDAFADFIVDYCKICKDSTGVEPYAVSPQNEPAFVQPYESCVYSDADLSRLVTIVATKLSAAGLGTRVIGAEEVNGRADWPQVKANPNLHAYAVHGAASSGTGHARSWMTEWDVAPWSGEDQKSMNWVGFGQSIGAALNAGFSWWTWFGYSNNCGWVVKDAESGVGISWSPNGYYYATRAFARFARPGAVRVGCTGEGSISAYAFKNPDETIAVVMINSGGATTTSITGTGLPASWNVYTISSTNKGYVGQSNGSNIALESGSIVSVISGERLPEIGADTIANEIDAPPPSNTIGEINAFGDDTMDIYLNGVKLVLTNQKRYVTIEKGENIISVKLVNEAWGGGLIVGMLLPGGDTLRSDGTWKLTIKEPPAAWTELDFDDSEWDPAHDMGPVSIWPGFARFGEAAVNYYAWNSRWISGAMKTYFRKTIDVSSWPVQYSGNNVKFKIYVDGVQFGDERTDFAHCEPVPCQVSLNARAGRIEGLPTGMHTMGFEVEDVSADGNGVLLKTWQATGFNQYNLFIDTTWKCWTKYEPGWNTAGFDDSHWANPGKVEAYDATSTTTASAPFIYPNVFWYRKKFISPEATTGVLLQTGSPRIVQSVQYSVERYNLRGQKIQSNFREHVGAGVVIIQRVGTNDASVRVTRKVELR